MRTVRRAGVSCAVKAVTPPNAVSGICSIGFAASVQSSRSRVHGERFEQCLAWHYHIRRDLGAFRRMIVVTVSKHPTELVPPCPWWSFVLCDGKPSVWGKKEVSFDLLWLLLLASSLEVSINQLSCCGHRRSFLIADAVWDCLREIIHLRRKLSAVLHSWCMKSSSILLVLRGIIFFLIYCSDFWTHPPEVVEYMDWFLSILVAASGRLSCAGFVTQALLIRCRPSNEFLLITFNYPSERYLAAASATKGSWHISIRRPSDPSLGFPPYSFRLSHYISHPSFRSSSLWQVHSSESQITKPTGKLAIFALK